MNSPLPPPAPPAPKKRAIWPWVLGGCLTLVLLGAVGLVAVGWFGLKALGGAMTEVVGTIPGVEEHFGTLSDISVNLPATGATQGTGMVLDITGSQGTGQLRLALDPKTGAFTSASVTLPDGETLVLDAGQLEQLQQLQSALPKG